jgi:hypothetical protein
VKRHGGLKLASVALLGAIGCVAMAIGGQPDALYGLLPAGFFGLVALAMWQGGKGTQGHTAAPVTIRGATAPERPWRR